MNKIVLTVVFAALAVSGIALAAQQTKQITYEDTTIKVVSVIALDPDGDSTFDVTACAEVRASVGGAKIPVSQECATCSGPLSAATLNTCKANWRTANGY